MLTHLFPLLAPLGLALAALACFPAPGLRPRSRLIAVEVAALGAVGVALAAGAALILWAAVKARSSAFRASACRCASIRSAR